MHDREFKMWVERYQTDPIAPADIEGKTLCNVVQVKLDRTRKIALYRHDDLILRPHERVVVETDRGTSGGTVICFPSKRWVSTRGLKGVLRMLSDSPDTGQQQRFDDRELSARRACIQLISQHNLDMKVVDVEYVHWENRTIFYFVSEGRVDFRELVKDLSRSLRCRIEMRQIGPRDETKMLGGLGRCGRVHCCSNHLKEFKSVRTKMAKEQGLVVNQEKITGHCRKLLCCLAYEKEVYIALKRELPSLGTIVQTREGLAKVVELQPLRDAVRIHLKETGAYKLLQSVVLVPQEGTDEEGNALPPMMSEKQVEKLPDDHIDPAAPPEVHGTPDSRQRDGQDDRRGRSRRRDGRNRSPQRRKESPARSDSQGKKPQQREGQRQQGGRPQRRGDAQGRDRQGAPTEGNAAGGEKKRSGRSRRRSRRKPTTES